MRKVAELRRYEYVVQSLLGNMPFARYGEHMARVDYPAPGDLVMLTAAPQTDWHLSFYVSRDAHESHLLESVKTGKLCHWSNVGLLRVDLEKCGINNKARWTDAMFEFERRFRKASKAVDAYIEIPFIESFVGDTVQVKVRTRWGLDADITALEPMFYRRMTQKAIATALKTGITAHANRPKHTLTANSTNA